MHRACVYISHTKTVMVAYKIEDATESASKSRSPTSGTRPVSSAVLDTSGRAVDRLLMKNVKIFCLTAFHTLSLLYFPLLHFLLPHFQRPQSWTRLWRFCEILAPAIRVMTYVLTYLLTYLQVVPTVLVCTFQRNVLLLVRLNRFYVKVIIRQ